MIRLIFATRLIFAFIATLAAAPLHADVNIQEIASPGGINAWLVEENSIPFVALELRFRGGASLDAPGKRGVTNLMTGLLEEGAGDLNSRQFSRATEGLAASFSYDASDDTITVSARFLTENRDQAIELLRDSLITPRFDTDAVERVRAQVISGIKSNDKDPNAIGSRAFRKSVYGDHPYGSSLQGTLTTIAALTRDDIIAAHHATMARDRMYIAAVGDINADELSALLDHLLGDLPASGAPLPGLVTPQFDGEIHVIDFDTPQSVALFGQPGIDRDDPDFFAAYVLNMVLGGGGFESRLMQEVREKRGLTYGVYSYLVDKDHAQVWRGSVASANDRVAEAISVIKEEWVRMRTDGVTEQELADAKTFLTGAYPLRFDGNGRIANIMVSMQMENLGIDYIATRNDRVNAVTRDDVARVAKRLLDPARLTFTVVGRPEGL